MIPTAHHLLKHYGAQRSRGLQSALIQRLGEDFPRLGGPRILELCAQMLMEVIDQHLTPRERLQHGQILWHAIDLNDRPTRSKTAARTRKVPVILTLHHLSDVDDCLKEPRPAGHWAALRLKRALRMSREAHAQGGLLGNIDLSLLLGMADSSISALITAWEEENNTILPRRTTLHDVGSGVTHKRIICRMRHLEGKDPPEVARQTWHTLQSVDRYLGQYDRVRHCRQQGMSPAQTAHILSCSTALVKQYLQIDDEINHARNQPAGANEAIGTAETAGAAEQSTAGKPSAKPTPEPPASPTKTLP